MATRSGPLAAALVAGTVLLAPAFVLSGVRVQTGQATALRGSTAAAPQQAPSSAGACLATVAVAGAAAAATAAAATRKRVSQSAVRRELAIAYEESGVNLVSNGKFAEGLIGAEGAWGRYEFDPAGLSSRYVEFVPYFREAELKHGRMAMLAWLGLVVPDFVRVPGDRFSFEAVPQSIDAHDAFNAATGVDFQILFFIAFIEIISCKKVFEWNSLETAGDFGLTTLFPADEEGQKRMRISELKNGRLAMVAFGGAISQAVLTHHSFPWLY